MGKELTIILLVSHHLSLLFGQYESKLKLDNDRRDAVLAKNYSQHFKMALPHLNEHNKQTISALWKDLIAYLKSIPYSHDQILAFLSD